MPSLGPTELIIILVIVLVIFGPKKLPGLGRSLGTGMREFKDSVTGKDSGDELESGETAPTPQASTPGEVPVEADVEAPADPLKKPAAPPSSSDAD